MRQAASELTNVTLVNVNMASTGRYKCEVSADAHSFQTSSSVVEMFVIGAYYIILLYFY